MTNKLFNLVSPKLLMLGMTMAALITPTPILAQSQKTVTGIVLDENGEPLMGATVKPKSVIRISLCRTAKRNPLIFPI